MSALGRRRWWVVLALAGCGDPSPSDSGPARVDADGDGVSAEEGDCDDSEALIGPGRLDELGNDVDEDCDGADGVDADRDGVASEASGGLDCDDGEPRVRGAGAADPVDGLDQDCDGRDGVDADGDGEPSLLSGGTDCNDDARDIHPGARELCDGVDEDCDGTTEDERGLITLPDGTTFASLAAAVAAAPLRAEVRVCAGTWAGGVTVTRPLTLVGVGAVDAIVLDGDGKRPVLTVDGVELVVRGLTIANGLGAQGEAGTAGGGVRVLDAGVLQLTDVILRDHTATDGAAVHATGGSAVVLTRVTAFGNTAARGAVLWTDGGDIEVVDSVLRDNTAAIEGQAVFAHTSTAEAAVSGPVSVSLRDTSVLGTRAVPDLIPEAASRAAAVSVSAGSLSLTGGELVGFDGTAVSVRRDAALPVLAPSLDVTGTLFDDNVGRNAGAISLTGPGVLVVDGARFTRNRGRAGGLYVTGDPRADTRNVDPVRITRSEFEGNVGSAGAGVLAVDVDLLAEDVTFAGNLGVKSADGLDGVGGAIGFVHASSNLRRTLRVMDGRFVDNGVVERGGALMLVGAVDVMVEDSTFDLNFAATGGAIAAVPLEPLLLGEPKVTLTRVVATENIADADGGMLHAEGAAIELHEVTIAGGRAGARGGALCVDRTFSDELSTVRGSLNAVGLRVDGSEAGGDGGALFSSAPSAQLTDVVVEDTRAQRGGAFAFRAFDWPDDAPPIAVSVTDLLVEGAVAAVSGGAVDSEGTALRVTGASVRGSRAPVGGGFSARQGFAQSVPIVGSIVLIDVVLERNVAAGAGEARGGGVAAAAVPLTVLRMTASQNRAEGGFGGAVAAYVADGATGSSTVSVTDGWFSDNLAAEGAGMWLNAATGTLSRVTFADNEARARGAGLSVVDYTEGPAFRRIFLSDASFTRNVSTLGGGVFMSNVDLRVVGVSWLDNRARWGAGLAFQAGARTRLSIERGVLSRNLADALGGGLYLVAPQAGLGDLTLTQVTFGLQADVNSPDDIRIHGVGRANELGQVGFLRCTALGPACL